MIVFGHGSFTFENRNGDSLLIILISGKSLSFFGGNERSFGDDFGHNTANSLNTEGQRGSVNNNQRFSFFRSVTTNDTTLDGSSESNGFIRVDTSVGLFTIEEFFNQRSDFGDTGGTTN